MHKTLRSPGLQARFKRDGFVVTDLLSPEEAAQLRQEVLDCYVGDRRNNCHISTESPDPTYRLQLHDLLVERLETRVSALLVDHEVFITAALIKWPGPESDLGVHQDPTMVDEARFRSVNAWIPLEDTSVENGAIAMVAGSHRYLTRLRSEPMRPSYFEDPVATIDPSGIEPVPMSGGNCMVLDHGVLHYSGPNTTDSPRVAILLGLVPKAADLVHYRCREDDVIERYAIEDRSFFTTFTPGTIPPSEQARLDGHAVFTGDRRGAGRWLRRHVAGEAPNGPTVRLGGRSRIPGRRPADEPTTP